MSTPHNAAQKGQIAPNVLMAGDPLRAQFTAENYLESPVCFNTVRGMLGYTGTYDMWQCSYSEPGADYGGPRHGYPLHRHLQL